MKIDVYTLNAFAKESGAGNPAGIVLGADDFSDSQMQEIAKQVGFSETAFVTHSDRADFKVRFFTPTEEVDFCGHATIGTFFLLKSLDKIEIGHYTQETKAGNLSVIVNEDGSITMEQKKPKFMDKLTTRDEEFAAVCQSLGLEISDIGARPVVHGQPQGFFINHMEIISTGLKDLMIPVKSVEILNSIKPDMEKIKEISRRNQITGYHVFAMDCEEVTAQCRNFAPLVGIDEESATGSSSGALGSFLVKNKIVNKDQKAVNMVFEQGIQMGRPSEIFVSIVKEAAWGNRIDLVYVGGNATDIETIEVQI